MSDVVCEVIAQLPTKYGTFEAHGYVDQRSGEHHVALVKGDIADGEPVLCRVHSECLTGDTFGSLRCDCGEQRSRAMRQIEKEGRGVFLYMRQEGRGIGLINKLKAYVLQEQGMDTVEANLALGFKDDERDYSAGAMILQDLGIKKLRLIVWFTTAWKIEAARFGFVAPSLIRGWMSDFAKTPHLAAIGYIDL